MHRIDVVRIKARHFDQRREHVERTGGKIRCPRLQVAGPFDDAGDANAAFVEGVLGPAKMAGGIRIDARIYVSGRACHRKRGQAAVVAAEPDERIVGYTQISQSPTQVADGPVHGDDLAMVDAGGFRQVGERLHVLVLGLEWPVRRRVPDHDEGGLVLFVRPLDELQGFVDQNFRRLPVDALRCAVAT